MNPIATEARTPPSLLSLFLTFLRLGATAFGGPAIVPYIRRLTVERERWLDDGALQEGVALIQSIPGPTAMLMSGYVGLRVGGLGGAATTFVAFALPSFFLMIALSAFYVQASDLPLVAAALSGLKPLIVAIVAQAALMFARSSVRRWRDGAIILIAAGAFWLGLNSIFVVVLAAVIGLFLYRGVAEARSQIAYPARPYPLRAILIVIAVAAVALVALFAFVPQLFDLAVLMGRVSLFAFGGGFGALPLMFDAVVSVGHLMSSQTFLDGVALGQVTPGPVIITAAFVGYVLYGFVGAVVATLGVYLPSFLVLVAVEPYYGRLCGSSVFKSAISAVAVSFVGLLLAMTVRFALEVAWDWPHVLLAGLSCLALFRIEIIWVVIAATAVSMVLFQIA